MKYMVIIAQTAADGTVTPVMTAYDDEQQALSAYYMELAHGAISETLTHDMAALMATDGTLMNVCEVEGKAKAKATTTATTDATTATTGA